MVIKKSEFITSLAAKAGRIKLLRTLLFPPYWVYRKLVLEPIKKEKNKLFRENGLSVLKAFDECMRENNFEYTLAFGTMLGAVRENGFIKHDHDLDVAMWIDQYSPSLKDCLKKAGFTLKHELSVDNGQSGLELTFVYNKVDIDIFFIYPAIEEYPYCCDFIPIPGSASLAHSMERFGWIKPRRLQLPWPKEFKRIPFLNLELPVPVNAHEILSFRYGDNYMTPDPSWHWTDENKYTTEWEGKKGIEKIYVKDA